MKKIVNELLDELINCLRRDDKFELPKEHLKGVDDHLEYEDYISSLSRVTHWIRNSYLDLLFEDQREDIFLIGGEYQQNRWKDIFTYSPVVKELFVNEGETLVWNPELSIEEIAEIRKYVGENFKPKMHVYLDPKKVRKK